MAQPTNGQRPPRRQPFAPVDDKGCSSLRYPPPGRARGRVPYNLGGIDRNGMKAIEIKRQSNEQVVRGVVKRVTFRNPENGYVVLQLASAERNTVTTVVGVCASNITVGAHLMVRGTPQVHAKFGEQLSASSITITPPSSPEGIESYLSSGVVKGVGPSTAKRLVEAFGERTIEMICQQPQRVAAVRGVGKHRAALLQAAFQKQEESQELERFLLEHRITPNLSKRILQTYQNRAVEVLRKDPYALARDVRGIGFSTADQIAMSMGLTPTSPERMKAGLYHALERAADDGHVFLPIEQLLQRAQMLLGVDESLDLHPQLRALIDDEHVVQKGEAVYLRHLQRAEEFVARFVAERCLYPGAPLLGERFVEQALEGAAAALKVRFSTEQRHAVAIAARQRFLLVTGGPGCGKTTVIRALALLFERANKRLMLAAPTGRAAQRMAQVCNASASTIHRLLKFDPSSGRFLYNQHDQLPADAVIIDEASMIDLLLARDLFSAVPQNATLILVGDKDQLPSVGPGRVFGDLIAQRDVPTVSLSQLFRRSEESSITSIAHELNAGIVPQFPEPDGPGDRDAYFITRNDPEEAATTIEKLVADKLPRRFNLRPEEIVVLTPTNRGPLGTQVLNERLQAVLNPQREGSGDELRLPHAVLRVGDRVCQRVNNYNLDDIGVFNGDVGTVYSIDLAAKSLTVEMWDGRLIRYDPASLSQLSLAYAVTVHRSQGSEFPCVVLALHDSHYTLLERQLVYTAITRAKRMLVVVGSRRALEMATRRTAGTRRMSKLKEQIGALLGGPGQQVLIED